MLFPKHVTFTPRYGQVVLGNTLTSMQYHLFSSEINRQQTNKQEKKNTQKKQNRGIKMAVPGVEETSVALKAHLFFFHREKKA